MAPIGAVFGSWMNDRAIVYRRKYSIPDEWGTAVNVQAMVFGNMGDDSGSGVAFTRDPATGEKVFYGEYLVNAQGEDVVAGVRTPKPVAGAGQGEMPKAYKELESIRKTLEKHFDDMQDFEFTIEDGSRLHAADAQRQAHGAWPRVRIATDMVKQKLIDWKHGRHARCPPTSSTSCCADLRPRRDVQPRRRSIATGLPAGPGRGVRRGRTSTPIAPCEAAAKGEKVLLVRVETSPEDLRGMIAAEGILTARGGVSVHAALVARQMGKVCVCGAAAMHVDYNKRTLTVGRRDLKEGDWLSIDGTTGEVFAGRIETARRKSSQVLVRERRHVEEGPHVQELRFSHEVVRRGDAHGRAHQRRHARAGRERHRVRGRGHRPVAAPSTCSSRAIASTRCAR